MDLQEPENDENVTLEFHEASTNGNLAKVTNFLSRKEEIDLKSPDEKCTLHNAASSRFTEIVKVLLKIGVNINGLDNT